MTFSHVWAPLGHSQSFLAFMAFMRYMNYKETIALAEKGLTRPEQKQRGGYSALGDRDHGAGNCPFPGTLPDRFFGGK